LARTLNGIVFIVGTIQYLLLRVSRRRPPCGDGNRRMPDSGVRLIAAGSGVGS
jgi:hypothetical protein